MRHCSVKQVRVVEESTALSFQESLNRVLQEVGKFKYELKMDQSLTRAVVIYDECYDEPETIKEKYEDRGDIFICADCPFYKKPTDKRIKWVFCEQEKCRVCGDKTCCERFYELLDKGEIKPVI